MPMDVQIGKMIFGVHSAEKGRFRKEQPSILMLFSIEIFSSIFLNLFCPLVRANGHFLEYIKY